ncbi:MAG: helix-turn-helix domain-containing protein [Candidatus Buchananbacteria bacterium]|nr:helix-turn-helix domain-containing protein [Candidatus Buchananbacteria bacterium]
MLVEQYLQNIGLNDKEAKFYLAGLQLGPSSLQELAKNAGIKRTTGYEIMDEMVDKNLFTMSQRGKRKVFIAQEPDNLLLFLKQRENILSQIMPDLEAIKNISAHKPAIRIYEGIEGIKQVYQDMIKKPGEILALAAPRPMIAKTILDYLTNQWKPLRIKGKIKMRRVNINESGEVSKDFTHAEFLHKIEKVKYLPADNYPFSVGIYIYRHKVAFVSFAESELTAIIVRSPEISSTMKMIFEMYWK